MSELKKIVDQFIVDYEELRIRDDVAIREPRSKHQRKLRQLSDLVEALKHNVQKHEGQTE